MSEIKISLKEIEILKEKVSLFEAKAEYLELLARVQAEVIETTIPIYGEFKKQHDKAEKIKSVKIKKDLFYSYVEKMNELILFIKEAERRSQIRGYEIAKKLKDDMDAMKESMKEVMNWWQ